MISRFNPEQVEHVPLEGETDVRFQNGTVYITIDPSFEQTNENSYVALAAVELSRKLVDPFNREVIATCTENSTACQNRPPVSCSTPNAAVIYLKTADEARVTLDGNCATIQGRGEGIVMAAHRALFKWLQIME